MQIIYSITTVLCLCIGFYFGYKIGKNNELPVLIKSRKQIKEEKKEEKEINKLEKALNNLNRYDGTSKGQEEII